MDLKHTVTLEAPPIDHHLLGHLPVTGTIVGMEKKIFLNTKPN